MRVQKATPASAAAYEPCRSLPSIRALPSMEELMLQRQLNERLVLVQRLDRRTEKPPEQATCS
jgi:hypothetical protein